MLSWLETMGLGKFGDMLGDMLGVDDEDLSPSSPYWRSSYSYREDGVVDESGQAFSEEPLVGVGSTSYVRHIGSPGTVDVEIVGFPRRSSSSSSSEDDVDRLDDSPGGRRQFETVAMAPSAFEIQLPSDCKPGQRVCVKGPQGGLSLIVPEGSAPGSVQRVRLSPQPEFRVEVPSGAVAGAELNFETNNGTRLSVIVPSNLKPGSTFDVLPPAVMVRVPGGARPGDLVLFETELESEKGCVTTWLRAVVPTGFAPLEYFAARVPVKECPAL